jgi:hypothetical protein
MSQSISNIKGHIEHINGELHWLKLDPSKEMKLAVKQFKVKLNELENDYLPNIIKALNG